ncbi:MAG: adenosylmethionine--8-amino-7-oxononanoate transaminase [Gammaproteobacteria bacterium]|nr:MAG: adenosylmethionine--8-amino-7-oxononanoate transaminase [Gammaproteobacteria bacterium]RLA47209.1 MAG: adenosylmethionine--8-amino-7-oxononanoate transaminase [Gammaproteobacteria bacterium]
MKSLTASEIHTIDTQHIWHPYASLTHPVPAYNVVSADGVRLQLADGRSLIDGMSSWWCAIHGYNHPVLNDALTTQLEQMAHVMFGGLTHAPAAQLAKRLVSLTPEPLDKVFFSDSGSVSVEVAIKMALQYWQSQGRPEKSRLLALKNGYHGDTFAAMSVCDPETGMHHMFKGMLAQQVFSEAPRCKFGVQFNPASIDDFEAKICQHANELAAVIVEPVVQGAGGMRFYSPQYLAAVRELCDRHNVLLIADEIATGFGRTGKLFACEWADISPDIMCLGKALTGGYLTLAATLCNEKISNGICQGEAGVFMHGPTFMANPLACAVANASIDLLLDSPWQKRVERIEAQLKVGLAPCADMKNVRDVRVLGAIGVVEMNAAVDIPRIQKLFVDAGVWLRPFGKLVYVMPPYVIDSADLNQLTSAMVNILSQQSG